MKIDKTTAKKLFPESPEWFKEELIKQFGKETFEKRDFRDIKTFEDACKELDISTAQFLGGDTRDETAYKKLKIIIQAINQGWTPNWSNSSQRKWWPWFVLSSGFGFSYSDCNYTYTFAGVSSRLCTDTKEKAVYMATQFEAEYKDYLLIPQ